MRALTTVALIAATGVAAGAVQTTLDHEAVGEAVRLGETTNVQARTRFNDGYRLRVAMAPMDYLDVVTPFRRIVLAAQEQVAAGERRLLQRQAVDILRETSDQLDVYLELTFHPLNTYIGVPDYQVSLVPLRRGEPVEALALERVSRWTPRLGDAQPSVRPFGGNMGGPERGQSLIGGTVIAHFSLRALDPNGIYAIVIREQNQELARVTADLGRMR